MSADMTSSDVDLGLMFASGVASVALQHGMSEKDAEVFTSDICKKASGGWNDDDPNNTTFWGRNKSWMIPAIASALAFYIGADGERYGRLDRSYLSNAGNRLWDRVKRLFGYSDDPLFESVTSVRASTPPPPAANAEKASDI